MLINCKGFSILELAVVLGIVGIVGSGLGMMYSEQKSLEESKTDQAKLILVKKALTKFVKENHYMPCPDTSNNGLENRSADNGILPPINAVAAQDVIARNNFAPTLPAIQRQLGQAQINGVPVNVCSSASGRVPFETLNLSRALVEDINGNAFIYAVDLGVTQPDNMLNCPNDSACFFNSDPEPDLTAFGADLRMPYDSLPAFDATTLPVNNTLGANNLRVCSDAACGQVLQDGLIAVVLTTGPDDHQPLAADEDENLNNDATFVKRPVTKSGDFFNDLILGIAANEIRSRRIPTSAEVVIDPINNDRGRTLSGNDVQQAGALKAGTSGSNNSNDNSSNFMETATQNFDFGAENAGETVEIRLDTRAVGTWDYKGPSSTSNDKFYIDANNENLYSKNYNSAAGNEDGYLKAYTDAKTGADYVLRDSDVVGNVADYSEDYVDVSNINGSPDKHLMFWEDSHSFFVELDENGQLQLDLKVGTTGSDETVDFTNIQVSSFLTPPDPPDFPIVNGINGIPQTQELNNDKSIRFENDEESEGP